MWQHKQKQNKNKNFFMHGLFHHAVTSLDSLAAWLELLSSSRSRATIMAALQAAVRAADWRPTIMCRRF